MCSTTVTQCCWKCRNQVLQSNSFLSSFDYFWFIVLTLHKVVNDVSSFLFAHLVQSRNIIFVRSQQWIDVVVWVHKTDPSGRPYQRLIRLSSVHGESLIVEILGHAFFWFSIDNAWLTCALPQVTWFHTEFLLEAIRVWVFVWSRPGGHAACTSFQRCCRIGTQITVKEAIWIPLKVFCNVHGTNPM